MNDESEIEESGPFEGMLGQATNERGFSLFRNFNPLRPGPFGGTFTLPGMQTTAPSPTPGLRLPRESLVDYVGPGPKRQFAGTDPRAAVWRFQAQVKKCPTCPSQIVETYTPPALITAEQAWELALQRKAATKAQWMIVSRQRKQGEPKAGEWFSVWIPTATLQHLKNMEP